MTVETEVLLTSKEVAERTKLSEQTLRKWRMLKTGPGPPFRKLGRAVRYVEAELVEWMERD